MDNYNVVIDHTMIQNIVQTNIAETADLFTLKLLYYVVLLGKLPSIAVYFVRLEETPWKRAVLVKRRTGFP